jgi:dihydrofolate reductase
MGKLVVFDQVSLDGYFTDANDDMSWAHQRPDDVEWNSFVADNAGGDATLLFGRKTYELMVRFWPTPEAARQAPQVAAAMNAMPKLVFSRTLERASWNNTRLVAGNLVEEVRTRKQGGSDLVILGSGTLVSQLAQARLVDEFQIVVNPLVLGSGRTLFEGCRERLDLRLTRSRAFHNGNVVLWYQPA